MLLYFLKKFVTNVQNRSLIDEEVRWWKSLTKYILNIFRKYINL